MTNDDELLALFKKLPCRAKEETLAGIRSFASFMREYKTRRQSSSLQASAPQTARREETGKSLNSVKNASSLKSPHADAAPPSVNTKLEVAALTAEQRSAIRLNLVRRIYEPDLSAELVDRIVDLQAAGVRAYEINAAIKRSAEDLAANRVRAKWVSLSAWAKAKYEERGATWTPCSKEYEPRPEPEKPKVAVYYKDKGGRSISYITDALNSEEVDAFEQYISHENLSASEVRERIKTFRSKLSEVGDGEMEARVLAGSNDSRTASPENMGAKYDGSRRAPIASGHALF